MTLVVFCLSLSLPLFGRFLMALVSMSDIAHGSWVMGHGHQIIKNVPSDRTFTRTLYVDPDSTQSMLRYYTTNHHTQQLLLLMFTT